MKAKFVPRISQPCSQDWNAMAGDERRRFCEQCQLHVHNLSAMSDAEREALISQRGARQCIAYIADDRSIRVRTGTWLLLQRLLRPWRAGLALLAVLLPIGSSGCATTHQQTPPPTPETHACKQARELPDGKYWVGGITYEPPLWRRILFFWER
jgi:hypothetical protein